MTHVSTRRAVAAAVVLLLAAATAYAPPIFRPTTPVYRPPVYTPPPVYRPVVPHIVTPSAPRVVVPPVRTAPMVHAEIRGVIATRPATALSQLHAPEVRTLLPKPARVLLALEAANHLAARVESGTVPASRTLAEVRAAQASAAELSPAVRARLDVVARTAERRALAEPLADLRVSTDNGKWNEAGYRARHWLERAGEPGVSPEFRTRHAEVRQVLEEVRDVSTKLEALDRFAVAVRDFDAGQPATSLARLEKVEAHQLPPALRRQAETLHGVAEVRALASEPWGAGGPNVPRVKRAIAKLEAALADVPGANRQLGQQTLQKMAVKAHLEGHTEAYFELMPSGGPPEHAAALLRDMKALALGEGKVNTGAARAALPDAVGDTPPATRPPAGVDPLVPEGAKEGWRPPTREKASADLPPLEQTAALAEAIQTKAAEGVKPQQAAARKQAEAARLHLHHVHTDITRPLEQERRRMEELKERMRRDLTVEERFRAREWIGQGDAVADMAGRLEMHGPPEEDADDEFLNAVEKELGRPLTADERRLAGRLHRQGERPAAAAAHFRARAAR